MTADTDEEMLECLQRETFDYFLDQVDADTGLTADKTQPGSPSSIAVVGMSLTALVVGAERGFIPRSEAIRRTLRVLRFFEASVQGTEVDASGYKGFYYHFLDMKSGRRAWQCELSTIDTTFLIAGALTAAVHFSGPNPEEVEIRRLADFLYRRVDWVWALDGGTTVSHGWSPERGFLPYRWERGYSEAHLLYVLAMGSPSFPIGEAGYQDWLATFECKKVYGAEYLYAGPLFIHQFSQLWLDLRGVHDAFNRRSGIDYFDNSRRATYVHRQYAIENPHRFTHYGENCWGLTASGGPGPARLSVDGIEREFYGYLARGAPFGPDDGTISPWAVVASLPFAPEIVLGTIRHAIERLSLRNHRLYGFDASFNATFPEKTSNPNGWVSPWKLGLNQGPIVIMIENFYSGLVWKSVRRCEHIVRGLCRAGFRGGWLERSGDAERSETRANPQTGGTA